MSIKLKLQSMWPGLAIFTLPLIPPNGWMGDKPPITIHNLINLTGIYAPISVPYESSGGKEVPSRT